MLSFIFDLCRRFRKQAGGSGNTDNTETQIILNTQKC